MSIVRELMPPMQRTNESYLLSKSKQGKRPRVDGVSAVSMTVETDDMTGTKSAPENLIRGGERVLNEDT